MAKYADRESARRAAIAKLGYAAKPLNELYYFTDGRALSPVYFQPTGFEDFQYWLFSIMMWHFGVPPSYDMVLQFRTERHFKSTIAKFRNLYSDPLSSLYRSREDEKTLVAQFSKQTAKAYLDEQTIRWILPPWFHELSASALRESDSPSEPEPKPADASSPDTCPESEDCDCEYCCPRQQSSRSESPAPEPSDATSDASSPDTSPELDPITMIKKEAMRLEKHISALKLELNAERRKFKDHIASMSSIKPIPVECATCGVAPAEGGWRHKLCGGCASVRYCSVVCQKQHWISHKAACGCAS
jgi:hypothetical protein